MNNRRMISKKIADGIGKYIAHHLNERPDKWIRYYHVLVKESTYKNVTTTYYVVQFYYTHRPVPTLLDSMAKIVRTIKPYFPVSINVKHWFGHNIMDEASYLTPTLSFIVYRFKGMYNEKKMTYRIYKTMYEHPRVTLPKERML